MANTYRKYVASDIVLKIVKSAIECRLLIKGGIYLAISEFSY